MAAFVAWIGWDLSAEAAQLTPSCGGASALPASCALAARTHSNAGTVTQTHSLQKKNIIKILTSGKYNLDKSPFSPLP